METNITNTDGFIEDDGVLTITIASSHAYIEVPFPRFNASAAFAAMVTEEAARQAACDRAKRAVHEYRVQKKLKELEQQDTTVRDSIPRSTASSRKALMRKQLRKKLKG